MDFDFFSELCLNLKSTSKKLLKVQIISDYLSSCSYEDSMVAYDILSGNFNRELSKKEIGISIKSIFEVLSSYYMVSKSDIENLFSASGDIFKTIENLESNVVNKSLLEKESLTISFLTKTLEEISLISGKNSSVYKKNKLLSLFSSTKSVLERQILCALLSDLLKIGVNEGLFHDAFVFSYFPKIENFHIYDTSLQRFVINSNIVQNVLELYGGKSCKLLRKKLHLNFDITDDSKDLLSYDFEEMGVDLNLDTNMDSDTHIDENSINNNKNNFVQIFNMCSNKGFSFPYTNLLLKSNSLCDEVSCRALYNEFKNLFDSLYSFNVSYRVSFEKLQESVLNLVNAPIVFNKPIKVMLGPRLYSFDEIDTKLKFPLFCDYKYDGLRLVIQNNYGEIRLFSRNLENLTSQFPEIISFMKENFSNISCVLDCECVGFENYTFKQVEFQELSKRIMTKSHNLKSNIILGMRIFDILELKGEFVHTRPLEMRQKLLRDLFRNSQINIDKKISSKEVIDNLNCFFNQLHN